MNRIFLYVLLIFAIAGNAIAQNTGLKITAAPEKMQIKAGEGFLIKADISLTDPWYTYSIVPQLNSEGIGPAPTEIYVKPYSLVDSIREVWAEIPHQKMDKGFNREIDYYKEKAEFLIKLKALKDIDLNKDKLTIEFYIQVCDTTRCLPSETVAATFANQPFDNSAIDYSKFEKHAIKYVDGYFTAQEAETAKSESNSGKAEIAPKQTESNKIINEKKSEGVLSFLWFAMAAGALALLTPCVFPMVPITVSFFTKRAEKTRGKGLRDSIVYAVGIISTFTAIGIIMSAIFGPTGIRDFATSGWVNIFIAVIFIVFAFNLFGAFEIQLPTGLLNRLNQKSQGSGLMSVWLMGLTFSLTSFTCTVPFVGSTLISTSSGEWFYPIIGMLAFSTVFAAPFFLLALFPSYLNKLPKAGGWMNNIKVVMGFLEIAAAIKFISNTDLVWKWGVLPREVFLSIWIACGLFIVLYILGKFKLPHDARVESTGSGRIIFALLFSAISIWLITGLFGKNLGELDAFLPPKDYSVLMGGSAADNSLTGQSNDEIKWTMDYKAALDIAKKENKPVFIDFTGYTCTNCRWMESNMFPRPDVKEKLNKMVTLRLYTDGRDASNTINKKMQQDRYSSVELPLYVILTPNEELISSKSFTRDSKEFLDFLNKGLNGK